MRGRQKGKGEREAGRGGEGGREGREAGRGEGGDEKEIGTFLFIFRPNVI